MPPLELTELGPAAQAELSAPAPVHPSSPNPGRFAAWRRCWPSALSVGGLLLLWWAASAGGLVSPLFLPGPAQVAARLADLAVNGFMDASLWRHAAASLGRVGLALLLAAATAVPLGMLMGLSRRAHAALDPLIEFYRPVPPLAYLPLIVIWFGIGEASKVLLIYSPSSRRWPSPPPPACAARTRRGCRRRARWRQPRPAVAAGGAAQRAAGDPDRAAHRPGRGLVHPGGGGAGGRHPRPGFMVQSAAQFLVTDAVIAGILIIAWIALALELGLRWVERRFAGWAAPERFERVFDFLIWFPPRG